jgi:hypothetical protein
MAPDYAHSHGTYEVSKRFYTKMVPQLKQLIEANIGSADAKKAKAAEELRAKLDEVLNSEDHKWYLGKTDPEVELKRKRELEEFRKRYEPAPAKEEAKPAEKK